MFRIGIFIGKRWACGEGCWGLTCADRKYLVNTTWLAAPQSLTQSRGHSPSRADSVVSSGHVASLRPLGWFLPVPLRHRKHEGESRNSFTVKMGGSSDFWRDYLHTDKLLMTNNARTHSRDSLYWTGKYPKQRHRDEYCAPPPLHGITNSAGPICGSTDCTVSCVLVWYDILGSLFRTWNKLIN